MYNFLLLHQEIWLLRIIITLNCLVLNQSWSRETKKAILNACLSNSIVQKWLIPNGEINLIHMKSFAVTLYWNRVEHSIFKGCCGCSANSQYPAVKRICWERNQINEIFQAKKWPLNVQNIRAHQIQLGKFSSTCCRRRAEQRIRREAATITTIDNY